MTGGSAPAGVAVCSAGDAPGTAIPPGGAAALSAGAAVPPAGGAALSAGAAVPPAGGAAAGGAASPAGGDARIVGVSLGHRTLAEADHWIQQLVPAPVLACTHLVAVPFPHVAISLLTAAPVETVPELRAAAEAAAGGPAGRAVLFPGSSRLTGALTVSEILQRSSIARVEVLGGGPADPATVVDTGDFVRPQFRCGELVLVTTPAAGGRLIPFERRDPTPCCANH
ncbi:hypothetical protein [Actinoplanes teichomyceticus]|uniref:Uncharacterized protein n=1 Tax=Actinoplanes teichomyceticus TaxID=1867 RepID=A0A561WI25_ACTTI|nr:hypothetical protein [Actinoplanes teichomyceticus]TWG23537.1 hypothetical protein FHX34_10283 [Actinoplanes teichomyceticus]GIF16161.1 hypothetical protein Ate01nite_61930 [Actinoplanes teichomyceticus]